ncbi:hypothetical protein D9M71_557470 [compost metagenome]
MDLRLELEGLVWTGSEHDGQPQLMIMSSDETSNFTLHFEWGGARLASVSGDGVNEPQLHE